MPSASCPVRIAKRASALAWRRPCDLTELLQCRKKGCCHCRVQCVAQQGAVRHSRVQCAANQPDIVPLLAPCCPPSKFPEENRCQAYAPSRARKPARSHLPRLKACMSLDWLHSKFAALESGHTRRTKCATRQQCYIMCAQSAHRCGSWPLGQSLVEKPQTPCSPSRELR